MLKLLVAASALIVGLNVAHADPVADREALMKSFGRMVGGLAPVARGEKPFDAAEADAAFKALSEEAEKLDAVAMFPEGTPGESASPRVWEDAAGFAAAVDKFKADAAAAAATPPADLAAFQDSFGKIASNCGTCHEAYRVKKN